MYSKFNYIAGKGFLEQTIIAFSYDEIKIVNYPFIKLLDKLLLTYGNSLDNNRNLMKIKFDIVQNPPLYLILKGVILIPTKSIKKDGCILINFNEINQYKSVDTKVCRIEFKDGMTIDVSITFHTLMTQMSRSYRIQNYYGRNDYDKCFYTEIKECELSG